MGNNSSSGGSSSVGDYSNKGSFGKAFNAAHTTHGSGKQFTYNGKSYTTNCADGNEYKGGSKNNFTYSQSGCTFTNNKTGSSSSAHSGIPILSSMMGDNTPNIGKTPTGNYTVTQLKYDPSTGMRRGVLRPDGHDAKGRTALQVHYPSSNPAKAALNLDSRGCIVTDMTKNVKAGDKIKVTK